MKTSRSAASKKNTVDDVQPTPEGAGRFGLVVSLLVFAASLVVLWWHAAPGVSFRDAGEFSIAAACGGIPHPPGAPTWTMFATLFVKLGGFENAAYGTNLFCGLCGAITLGLMCWVVMTWVRMLYPRLPWWTQVLTGISGPLVLLHSDGFLEQSLTTEQYTLMTALIMGMVAVITSMLLAAEALRRRIVLSVLLGMLWGLAIGNHLSQIALGLLAAWAIWTVAGPENRIRDFLRLGIACFFGLAAGLLVFLWLPIRSHANPVLDWGNIETFDRFMWAIERKQWKTRPISDAPPNMVGEWILSYDLAGQLGIIGVVLALAGIFVLGRKRPVWLGWLAAIAVPYGAGMLLGHMRQFGIGANYISDYGVVDWHLPVYQVLAVAAAIGLAGIASRLLAGRGAAAACVLVPVLVLGLLVTAGLSIGRTSFRDYRVPETFIEDLLAPLPEHSFMVAGQDNAAFMLGYRCFVEPRGGEPWLAMRTSVFLHELMDATHKVGAIPDEAKLEYLKRTVAHPHQPYHSPKISIPDGREFHVYVDFLPEYPQEAPYLLPCGYLFEFVGRKVSNSQVRAADARWRREYPDLLRDPPDDAYRFERDAYARLFMQRGVYFGTRKMWAEAEEAFAHSLKWQPQDGVIWFYLADTLERTGKPEEAVEAYRHAIQILPYHAAARYNLAMLYAKHGHLQQAEQLLTDALHLDPDDEDAQRNLARVREMIQQTPGNQ